MRARLALAFAGAALAFRDRVFVRLQLEQCLIRRGLRRDRGDERLRGFFRGRFVEQIDRLLHRLLRGVGEFLGLLVARLFLQRLEQPDRFFLRLAHDGDVVRERARDFRGGLAPLDFPRRGDDLFLQLGELLGFLALAAGAFFRRLRARFVLAKDFLERPDFAEINVARRAPHLAIRPDVIGPQIKRDELVGLQAEALEREQMREGLLLARGRVGAEADHLGLLPGDRVGEAEILQAEIIPRLALEADLLNRREARIAARRREFQLRRAVARDLEHEIGGHLVRAAGGIDELQFVALALVERGLELQRRRAARGGLEIDHRLVPRNQPRRGDRLVQLEGVFQRRPLDGGDAPRVGDLFRGQPGVGRIRQLRIGAFEAGEIEDADFEVARLLVAVFDAVGKVGGHLGQRAAEDRIGEIFREGNAPLLTLRRGDNQRRVRGHDALELRQHHQPAAALDRRIAGRHRHAGFHSADQRRHRGRHRHGAAREREQPDAQTEHREARALHPQQTLVEPRAPPRALAVRHGLVDHALL